MTDRNRTIFLRALVVVVALFLGLSLNVLQSHDLFRKGNPEPSPHRPLQSAPQPPASPAGEEAARIGPAASAAAGEENPAEEAKAQAVETSSPEAASGDGEKQAPEASADRQAASEPAPSSSPEAQSQDSAQAGPQSPAAPEIAPSAPGEVETPEPGSSGASDTESNPPVVTSDADKLRAAKIGRLVPAEIPTADTADKTGHAQAKPDAAAPGRQAPATGTEQSGRADKAGTDGPAGAKGGKVLEVKGQDRPGEFVLTIVTDGPVERVTTFHAKGPARLGVDIWGGWQPSGPASLPVDSELMARIRLGTHGDRLRLVIDYKDKDLAAFTEPVVEKEPQGLVIRVPKPKQ